MTDQELELLIGAACIAINSCTIGNPPPKIQARDKRLRNPQPGDWVIERAMALRNRTSRHTIGRLILVRDEPYHDWEDEEFNGPAPMEKYWYIEDLDGNLHKWWNCEFCTLYTVQDYFDDFDRMLGRESPRMRDLAESRAKWARDAAFRHKLIVWEPR